MASLLAAYVGIRTHGLDHYGAHTLLQKVATSVLTKADFTMGLFKQYANSFHNI